MGATKSQDTNEKIPVSVTADELRLLHSGIVNLRAADMYKTRGADLESKAKASLLSLIQRIVSTLDGAKKVFSVTLKTERKPDYDKVAAFKWVVAPANIAKYLRLTRIRKDATETVITQLDKLQALRKSFQAAEKTARLEGRESFTMRDYLRENADVIAPFVEALFETIPSSPASLLELDASAYSDELKTRADAGGIIENGVMMEVDFSGEKTPMMPCKAMPTVESLAFDADNAVTGLELLSRLIVTDAPEGSTIREKLVAELTGDKPSF